MLPARQYKHVQKMCVGPCSGKRAIIVPHRKERERKKKLQASISSLMSAVYEKLAKSVYAIAYIASNLVHYVNENNCAKES